MELYISKNGTKLSKVRESFCVVSEEKEYLLSSEKIESIILESECSVTSGVIKLAFEKDIPIVVTDIYGHMMGQFYRTTGTKNGKLKKNQYKFFTSDEGLEIAKEWVIEKILNQKIHLEKLLKRRKKSLDILLIFNNYIRKIQNISGNTEEHKNIIMGLEGNTSKVYYKAISEMLDKKWKFTKREHQKAKEPYNIVLNYMFGVLYRKIETLLLQEGFDTSIGILHAEGNNRLPLLYDFIEKYRILALEGTFDLFNNKMIKAEYFLGDTLKTLSIEGKYIISSYFNNIFKNIKEYRGKKYKVEDIIKFEIKILKNKILEVEI